MVGSKEIIKNVISTMEESRCRNFLELESEFDDSIRAITDLIELWKRKIVDAGSLPTDSTGISVKSLEDSEEKENTHPNVALVTIESKDELPKYPLTNENCEIGKKYLDVLSMKVSELREHLRERNLDDKGLKKDLQERLQKDINEKEKQYFESEKVECVNTSDGVSDENNPSATSYNHELESNGDTSSRIVDNVIPSNGDQKVTDISGRSTNDCIVHDMDIDRNEPSEKEQQEDISMESASIGPSSSKIEHNAFTLHRDNNEKKVVPQVVSAVEEKKPKTSAPHPAKSPKKDNIGKKIMKLFSPNKVKKTTTIEKNEMEIATPSGSHGNGNRNSSNVTHDSVAVENLVSTTQVSMSDEGTLKVSYPQEPRGDFLAPTGPFVPNIVSHNKDQPDSKLVPNTLDNDNNQSQLDSLTTPAMPNKVSGKIFSSSTAQAKKKEIDEARKARLEKIRNKVKKNHETVKSIETESSVKQSTCSSSSHESAEERKKAIAAKMRQKYTHSKPAIESSTPSQQTDTQVHRQEEQKPIVMSPMDTYEMSDREESDSGGESDDHENSPQKKIPKWAQKHNLIPALERQFLDGPNKLDPDTIFPEVSTCDLEAIFGRKKERYLKRKSTGDWRKDRVTASEKLVYKRKMGFK